MEAGNGQVDEIKILVIITFKGLNIVLQDKSSPVIDEPARLFKILMHPGRLSILDMLRDGEHCVCHMEAHLGYRQSYISQQ